MILHERYHQLDRAPVRMVVLQAIAPALRPFQAGRVWLARWTASLEIAADQYALRQGSSRRALAVLPHQVVDGSPTHRRLACE